MARSPRAAWLVGLAALALSLGFTLLAFPVVDGALVDHLDPDGYGTAGRHLFESGRFDSVMKPPLYPVVIAAVSALAGEFTIRGVQVVQCTMHALTAVLAFALFRMLLPGKLPFVAALATASWPMLIWYTPRFWTETTLTMMLMIHVVVVAHVAVRAQTGASHSSYLVLVGGFLESLSPHWR